MSRVVIVEGDITVESCRATIAQLRALDAEAKAPIVMVITSYGGSVTGGLAVVDVMQQLQSPVYTLAVGYAMSCGSLLLAAGEPGHRYVTANTQVMIHQPRGGIVAKESSLDYIALVKETFGSMLSNLSGHDQSALEAMMETDQYLTADETVELGLADTVITHEYRLEDYL